MIAFVFPGQGSQRRGMGQGLFDAPEYAAVEREVDSILGYSLRKLCLEDTDNRLKETQFTQPCLYVVDALHYYKALREGKRAAYLAGHSLGEYVALLAAGVFDFIAGLRLVKKRGELMAGAKNGGMGAVVGLGVSVVEKTIRQNGLGSLDVANYNSPSQLVVSGPIEDINRAGTKFEEAGARMYMPLPVSSAFHSRYMADVGRAFAEFLTPFSFAAPRIPVIANVTAKLYPADSVKSLLVQQITQPVQWTRSVRTLMASGVTEFTELGPGNVLTRLVQQTQQEQDS